VLKAWEGSALLVEAPPDTQAWLARRFGHTLEASASAVIGGPVRVSFMGRSPAVAEQRHPLAASATLHPRYRFDQFIIGDSNRLAHAASLAVAELPGQAYNPLFLCAPPGLGKTHLLHAIGNYALAFDHDVKVRYTTVEAFTNQFINALGSRTIAGFKDAYREADVLLIDDVQFLASKVKTGEELFHTFNALYETGRQLVLTSDRLPQQLVALEQRLRERFDSGLVASIDPPDFATRVTILRKRVELDGIELANPAVLELIAERVTENIRALEAALIRIVAHHSLTRTPIDSELAIAVLGDLPRANRSLSILEIQASVANRYDLPVDELLSAGRSARVSWPRQVAMHLAHELTSASLQEIGAAFGGRHHATVLHACKRVSERVHADVEANDQLQQLLALLR
jgi:chromosomal replication initiator protein